MNTITINISEAKTNFSKYTNLVKKGNTVILAKRNIPFAQILPLRKNDDDIVKKRKSLMGSLRGAITIIGDVNQPLTRKELSDWYDNKI